MADWDRRLLDLAQYVSRWSKDPSTQMGAVIADESHRVVGLGYNGFPRGIEDSDERYSNRHVKYALTVHCEMNALLNANKSVWGCTLYTWPLAPCERCAVHFIQAGIARAVAPVISDPLRDRWDARLKIATNLLVEAGVDVVTLVPWDA